MIFAKLLNYFQKGDLASCLMIIGQHGIGEKALKFSKEILKSSTQNPHGFPDHLVEKQIDVASYPNFLSIACEKKEDGQMTTEITVDQIHLALHFLRTTPGIPGWRVLLINGAHKLNHFAANALLKSLEDPPKKTCILLLAQHTASIPATLRSRCQKWMCLPEDLPGEEALYVKGSQERLKELKEVGGIDFVKKLQTQFGRSLREIEQSSQFIGKDTKAFQVFLWLIPQIIYENFVKTKKESWLKAWEKVTCFLQEGARAHLDKGHFILACLVILRQALEEAL